MVIAVRPEQFIHCFGVCLRGDQDLVLTTHAAVLYLHLAFLVTTCEVRRISGVAGQR